MIGRQSRTKWLGRVAALAVLALVATPVPGGESIPLLAEGEPTLAARAALDQRVLSADTIRVRAVSLQRRNLDRALSENLPVRVEFFPDVVVETQLQRLPSPDGRAEAFGGWSAGAGPKSGLVIVRSGEALAASYTDAQGGEGQGRIFKLMPGVGGEVTAVELAPEKQPGCGVTPEFQKRSAQIQERLRTSGALDPVPSDSASLPGREPITKLNTLPEVDVAVLYTASARTLQGGTDGIRALINLAVVEGNLALQNSLNQYRMKLVYCDEAVGYQEATSQLTDLNALTTTNDGILDEAHTVRGITRADLVALVTGGFTDSCGIAWLLGSVGTGSPEYGFSVTASNCIWNKTFIHELGHNMGCMHAREDGGTGIFSYSFGHKFTGNNSVAYRTVMAYAPGTRIDHFSNPSVTYQGVATGIASGATAADNARTMNETYTTVQSYRTRLTGAEAPNLAAGPATRSVRTFPNRGVLTYPILVGNSGGGSIAATVAINPAIPGVSVQQTSGPLESGLPQRLELTVNTQGLIPGTYAGNIVVTGNSQTRSLPLTLVVDEAFNNNFVDARTLPEQGGTAASTTVAANTETNEPLPTGTTQARTVWWKWSYTGSPATRQVRVSSLGSLGDSFVGIYTGTAVNSLTRVTDSRNEMAVAGGIENFSVYSSPGAATFTAQAGTTYWIQVGTEGAAVGGTPVTVHLYPAMREGTLPGAAAFGNSGQEGSLFTQFNLGSRLMDDGTGTYDLTMNAAPRTRVFGVVEDPSVDLPYQSVGTGQFVRSQFYVSYSGPGDSGSATLSNLVPNYRFGLRTKAAVNAVLEVLHNTGTGDPANKDLARELGPSKDDTKPSRYVLDFDPVDVPALSNSTTEGIQRSFEAVADLPDYTYVSGRLRLTESNIFMYTALPRSVEPIKVYQPGGTNNNSDMSNPSLTVGVLGFNRDEILRYLSGSPNPTDYFGPGVINYSIGQSGMNVTPSASTGISFTSSAVPSTRMGVAAVDFTAGNLADRTDQTTRVRTSVGVMHMASFRVRTDQQSNTVPYLRFRARSAKFAWSVKLELNGARALNSTDGRTMLAQTLPGAGNGVQGGNNTAEGVWYNLIIPSPLDPAIRADRRITGQEALTDLFPLLASEPGPGENAASRRDLLLGFDVIDTLSFGTGHESELAANIRLNRIEVRQFPDVIP